MPLSLNGSGGITYPDGSVNTTRSVSTAGDTMTGLLTLPSLNVTTGNVGIGTSSPTNMLTVQTAATGTTAGSNVIARLQSNAFGCDATLQFSDNVANSSTISMVVGATVFRQNSIERARIDASGSFLFPNSTGMRPGSSGQYIVESTAFYQQSGGSYYLVTTAGGSTSDATLKTNVQQLSGALEKVCAIRGINFEFVEEPMCTADKGTQLGVIAQEVEAQYPEIVLTDDNGIKTVRYDRLVAPLIEAVKEQQTIIQSLTARIEALETA